MATVTVTDMVTTTAAAAVKSASPTSTAVPNQAGVLEGMNPSHYNPADPLVLFIIQAVIIVIACRLLHWPLSKLRQPRVIAEVVGGIVLGPTVLGRIPGYMDALFPKESMPVLSMAANLGLVLFLFLVGLEVDLRVLMSNWKTAASVSAAGMILPFGFGAALAYGLYHEFMISDGGDTDFGVYLLFIGVAMAITAFPVLARILTELKLLQTDVGTIVLSAGVGNDVVGWVLLALTVALVNAGTGLTALYVLLVSLGYILFLVYLVRPAFVWYLRRNGALENGPSQSMVGLTLLMVLASAFFTNIIGVHAIFGGFLIGLIVPHEGGFAVALTEKIEDLVTVLFLPLYFALSGLKTNIGLLNSGIVWGYVFAVIMVAFFAKIVGSSLAARACGLLWRESFTIGVLMSCKGLVELIVLNIGLQAGILSQRVFTIFVVMALVTTFATTPLTSWLYPPEYQKKLGAWKRGEIDWEGNPLHPEGDSNSDVLQREKADAVSKISRVTVLLRLENLPSIFTFVDLLGGQPIPKPKVHKSKQNIDSIPEDGPSKRSSLVTGPPQRPVEVHGVRLVELGQRTSHVMQVSEVGDMQEKDAVINVFRTFGAFHNVSVSAGISIAPEDSFADVLTTKAADEGSDLLLIPWTENGAVADTNDVVTSGYENRFVSQSHNRFIADALASSRCSTVVMVNRGFGAIEQSRPGLSHATSHHSMKSRKDADASLAPISPISDPSHHIFFPFFGGVDDRIALRFILQLAQNIHVTATVVHVVYSSTMAADPGLQIPAAARRDLPRNLSTSHLPSPEVPSSSSTSSESERDADAAFFAQMADSLAPALRDRVLFETVTTSQPLQYTVIRANSEVGSSAKNTGDLVVLGRAAREHRPWIRTELVAVLESLERPSGAGSETRKVLGDVAEALIVANRSSILVLQGGGRALEREMGEDKTAVRAGKM